MLSHFGIILTAAAMTLAFVGGSESAPQAGAGDGVTVVVTASYPGAGAQVVADAVAAPLEQQINGAEGLVRIESESRNDGSYVARLRFGPKTDPKLAVQVIQNRVALAEPQLPEVVKRGGVSVKAGKTEGKAAPAIALQDRGEHGHAALRRWSDAVLKRLATEGAAVKPEAHPAREEKQIFLQLDRERCVRVGVKPADVLEAARVAAPGATVEAMKKVTVANARGEKVPLGSLATFEESTGPALVYRVNLYPSVRVSGKAPEGKTAAEAAARWAELAGAEAGKGFAVENLTAK
jgi:multidrug efflux pump subunit AcrB